MIYTHEVRSEIIDIFDRTHADFEQQLYANLLGLGLRYVPEDFTKEKFDGVVLLALYDDKLYEGYLEFVEGILK